MVEPQAAATVMIARQGITGVELYMLRRNSRSAFMPDIFVFPGGRVEAQDGEEPACGRLAGALPKRESADGLDLASVYAAARETFEECGLLFATDPIDGGRLATWREHILAGTQTFTQMLMACETRVDARALRYFSRWITPPLEPRRFDTRFFVARAPVGQAARADTFETHDGLWIEPREALARNAAGSFALIFPTIKHLERLSAFPSVDALLDYASKKSIHAVTPTVGAEREFTIPPALENVW